MHDRAMDYEKRLIGVHELATYLEVPVKTLYAWRYRREGPPAFRDGRHLGDAGRPDGAPGARFLASLRAKLAAFELTLAG